MHDGLHDYADKLRALTERLLDHNARLIEQTRRSLSGNDKRYLGYF